MSGFERSDEFVRETARRWWLAMQPDPEAGRKGERAALARLRRTASPAEAMAEEPVLQLYRMLRFSAADSAHCLPRVAVIAMVLAHVREDPRPGESGRRPSAIQAVGRSSPDDAESAKMTPLRFRRLLACRDDEEFARQMRRFVALADRRVNVGDLAVSLLYWTHPIHGDRTRTQWAFDYYAAGAAAPRDETPAAA